MQLSQIQKFLNSLVEFHSRYITRFQELNIIYRHYRVKKVDSSTNNIIQFEVQIFLKKVHSCITIPCTSSRNCIYHFVCHVHLCFSLFASIKKKSNVPRGVDDYGDEVTLPSVLCRCPPGQCVPHSSRSIAQSFGLAMVKHENSRAIFHYHHF